MRRPSRHNLKGTRRAEANPESQALQLSNKEECGRAARNDGSESDRCAKRNCISPDFTHAFKNRNDTNSQLGAEGRWCRLWQYATNGARRVMLIEMNRMRIVVEQRHADPATKPDRHQKRTDFLPAILEVHDALRNYVRKKFLPLQLMITNYHIQKGGCQKFNPNVKKYKDGETDATKADAKRPLTL